ncbi:putative lipoprotein [Fibrobacter succinogenes subsp. succinogenes S85]|nr:putative lipoprotein [Fibrobacter succinogenes subsp. succinogenes S85]
MSCLKFFRLLRMKFAYALTAILCGLFVACSEEKKEPLPDLPPVEIPADVFGFYSGKMPCDDCKQRVVDMDLFKDGNALAVESILKDSLRIDTLRGTFVFADSVVKVSLSDNSKQWAFKRDRVGNLAYMKFGEVYRDAEGMKAVLVRFYKKIK